MNFLITATGTRPRRTSSASRSPTPRYRRRSTQAKKAQFSTATQFDTFLTSTGQTVADVTYRIRVEQMYAKLLAREPSKVTPAAIAAYYNNHKAQFGTR